MAETRYDKVKRNYERLVSSLPRLMATKEVQENEYKRLLEAAGERAEKKYVHIEEINEDIQALPPRINDELTKAENILKEIGEFK